MIKTRVRAADIIAAYEGSKARREERISREHEVLIMRMMTRHELRHTKWYVRLYRSVFHVPRHMDRDTAIAKLKAARSEMFSLNEWYEVEYQGQRTMETLERFARAAEYRSGNGFRTDDTITLTNEDLDLVLRALERNAECN